MTIQKYDPAEIEKKWQKIWEKEKLYATPDGTKGKKKYVLDMFPYPSGAGLHVGHMEGYVATDVVSRYLRMKGYTVLHPMGWDAFGLPAENYAIKTGTPPDKSTHDNIDNFRKQLKLLGLSYDWDREIDTSDPGYYKWTQWLFIQLFNKGLAYKKKAASNWCPKDETVLANEQVVDGKCERCGTEVEQKELDQWFFKITDYADKLIEGLDRLDWPDSTKTQQINWIGRKEGINIKYPISNDEGPIKDKFVEVFTTRPDTNFGATFIVLSPENKLVDQITSPDHKKEVDKYLAKTQAKKELERITEGRKKTGVFTGAYAVNHLTGKKMPIWVSDFVLDTFGTGALVGVPGHDRRDFEFAKEFGLEITRVVMGKDGETGEINAISQVQEEEGVMINSGFLDGLDIHAATTKIMDYIEEKGWGKRTVTYHLRDWLISRQRYWGCPIPMIYCSKDGWHPVPEGELPVTLPLDVDFLPHGESPIARSKSFQEGVKCPVCGGAAKRETDTMDGFADNSWYFVRFTDPHNSDQFSSVPAMKQWLPVDMYVGGGHVVQHLLYSRFFYKVLTENGLIPDNGTGEPFLFLRAPGWILGPDARKMSKRWGNVITPEEVVLKHGADAMRTYEMFMAPFEIDKPWNVNSVAGVQRFLARINGLVLKNIESKSETEKDMETKLEKLVLKVGRDIENFKFNTAIAAMMEFLNAWEKSGGLGEKNLEVFLKILAPFAPHLAEELWQKLKSVSSAAKSDPTAARIGSQFPSPTFFSVHQQQWPEVDTKVSETESIKMAISVDGKTRDIMEISSKEIKVLTNDQIVEKAKNLEKVGRFLEGKSIKNTIIITGKIVNFVTN